MNCRPHCGACCTALSITSPLPGMPAGKPAGVICANLDRQDQRCLIWGSAEYPQVCRRFIPAVEVCGATREQAIRLIDAMERATR